MTAVARLSTLVPRMAFMVPICSKSSRGRKGPARLGVRDRSVVRRGSLRFLLPGRKEGLIRVSDRSPLLIPADSSYPLVKVGV